MAQTLTISVTVTPTTEFLSDILTTAFDGSYGGCWYWARAANNEERAEASAWRIIDDVWEAVTIADATSGVSPTPVYTATQETIAVGIQRILNDTVKINKSIKARVLSAVTEMDAGYIDAGDADCVVQAGLFGEVIYG